MRIHSESLAADSNRDHSCGGTMIPSTKRMPVKQRDRCRKRSSFDESASGITQFFALRVCCRAATERSSRPSAPLGLPFSDCSTVTARDSAACFKVCTHAERCVLTRTSVCLDGRHDSKMGSTLPGIVSGKVATSFEICWPCRVPGRRLLRRRRP